MSISASPRQWRLLKFDFKILLSVITFEWQGVQSWGKNIIPNIESPLSFDISFNSVQKSGAAVGGLIA